MQVLSKSGMGLLVLCHSASSIASSSSATSGTQGIATQHYLLLECQNGPESLFWLLCSSEYYHKKPDNTRCSSPELKEKSFLKPLRRTGSLLLPPERNWLNKQASGSPEFK
jgi:hypothetical protein